jgi:hypothetical protein
MDVISGLYEASRSKNAFFQYITNFALTVLIILFGWLLLINGENGIAFVCFFVGLCSVVIFMIKDSKYKFHSSKDYYALKILPWYNDFCESITTEMEEASNEFLNREKNIFLFITKTWFVFISRGSLIVRPRESLLNVEIARGTRFDKLLFKFEDENILTDKIPTDLTAELFMMAYNDILGHGK